ncbi:WXG100 family type VII secretion target [Nocardia brevicatena]|uniref:WXG100 family type VII secretion target n=1 Tax=Nocardia brevicatena TaxID=37327 RepID=UPI0012F70B0E|nr:WXG100 family type VII secretion target [Nocardia brevicatena]
MSIQIPSEVVFILNALGLPYPDVDADQVRELSRHVSDFATDVRETHESATGVVKDMGSVYSGESYQALLAAWGRMSAGNMAQLDAACGVVAKALDIAADVIEVVQVAVLAELAALAVTYAAMMLTPAGLVLRPLIAAAARRLLSSLQETLVWYIAAEVLGKAIEPLEDKIEQMVNGTLYSAASDALGVPPGGAPVLHIEPDEVMRYAKVLDDHADAMLSHAEAFAEKVAGLDFTTPGLELPVDGEPVPAPASSTVSPPTGIEPIDRFAQPSPPPEALSSPPSETQRPLTATPPENAPGSNTATTEGQRGDRGIDPPGTAAPTTAPPVSGTSAEPGRALSAPDNPAGRTALDEPGRNSADSGSTTTEGAAQSPRHAESTPLLDRPAATADTGPAATADTASSRPVETTPRVHEQTPLATASNEQHPAGPTRQAQGSTDRSPARPPISNPRQSSRRQAAQTPWSRAGRAAARIAAAAKRSSQKATAVSAGQTGNREQPADTPWSKAGSARGTDTQVFAPDTTPPSESPSKASTPERNREAHTDPPAQTADSAPRGNQPPAER